MANRFNWLRYYPAASTPPRELLAILINGVPWIIISVFSLAYIRLALTNHFIFRTGEDLAHYGQALWHLSYGRLPYSSFKGFVLWGDHGHFIMALLAPFYRLWPDVRLLLYVQALAVTLAGWPVYRVALALLKNKFFANAALFSYVSFIGIQYALNFDFHPSVLTGVAICWLLYALYFKKYYVYWTALALGLLTREDAGPIFFLIGCYQVMVGLWRLRQRPTHQSFKERLRSSGVIIGAVTAAVAMISFLITVYYLMPLWTPDNVPLIYFTDDNKDFWHIVKTLVKYPRVHLENMFDTAQKRTTINTLFASFAYLPLLSPFTYISSASIFFSRFVNTNDYRWAIDNHSNANILPLLTFGAIYASRTLHTLARRVLTITQNAGITALLGVVLIASAIVTSWTGPTMPLRRLTAFNQPDTPIPAARAASFKEAVQVHVHPADKVSASSGLTGDLSNRWDIYNFPNGLDKADAVVVSLRINTWPLKRDEMIAAVQQLKKDPTWEKVWDRDEILVFRRK